MKKTLQIANGIALVSTIIINYLSNTGAINNTTIGEVSNNIDSRFTPAGYAFSIWGIIYLLLLGFIIYQGRSLFVRVRNDDFVLKTGWWFVISCMANSAWVLVWLCGYIGLSCVFIFLLLFALLRIVVNNDMELYDEPISVISFVWWPFVIYSGWVTVASITNVAAYLKSEGWDGFGVSQVSWTIIMIIIATVINLMVIWKRNMREFALVGAWALVAIAIANNDTQPVIMYVAVAAAVILVISSAVHGYKNRATNPIEKCRQYLRKS
ncbi:tryptophan-rich sensory protein [Subsaxibacter sp. CAU 1640]|uniref:tryptophan-rich sensory protein n=1 Tax=Subsaxibacter sp. CAU 1640 TaxID=2933271 RepID=UPI0020045BC3|nr:tryptophan-rich sensory protein [Subsaxibacter sp. CAU 1640]MCK7591433.1 tryptophan-rich sensory protein [Subsaxibacter sp. CAU 1640]